MPRRWTKLDLHAVQDPPAYLDDADVCYYAREYVSHGGWSASEANQLISNFKKKPNTKGTYQWAHREAAVSQIARELAAGLAKDLCIAAIPTSKTSDDPEYDHRFEDLFTELRRLRPDLHIEAPIACRESHQSVHTGGARHPDLIYDLLEWRGFVNVPSKVCLIDDLLTTGGHFKACQRLILEHHPSMQVNGIFLAKCIWTNPENESSVQ
jgi:hypothetical protein